MLIQNQYNKLILLGNIDRAGNTTMFFIIKVIEEVKESILDFSFINWKRLNITLKM